MRSSAWWPTAALGAVLACGRGAPPPSDGAAAATALPPPAQEPPVALNPDPPIQYPPALFDQQVEGTVVLRLFVDSTGKLSAESTRVSESSGYPALDSAAVAGAGKLQFAPARRHGIPVATVFLQPIEFHHPVTAGAAAPVTPPVVAPKPRPTVRRARPDSTPAHPDTVKPRADTTRADTTQKTDTNAVAH